MSYQFNCRDWTEIIVPFGKIKSSNINEFKVNIDWLKDNLACQTHNSSVLTNNNSLYDNLDRGSHFLNYNNSDDSTHLISNDAANNTNVRLTHNAGDDATYYTNDCNTDICPAFHLTHYNGENSAYATNYDTSINNEFNRCSGYGACPSDRFSHHQPIYQ